MLLLTMGIYTHFYYLPFYFQAVRGTTAEQSGIHTIPYIVSLTVASVLAGASITLVGWYVPFLLGGTAIFAVGSGLLYTLQQDTPSARWIGYQILAGVGAGTALQTPFIAVQTVLDQKNIPTGNALAGFFNSCGAAISISAAQNVFSSTLVRQLRENVPSIDPQVVLNAGPTHVGDVPQLNGVLHLVLQAYNVAVTKSFMIAIVTGSLAFLIGCGVEWNSVKGKKTEGALV